MNARIWDKVGLKFVEVDIQGAIKAEGGSN